MGGTRGMNRMKGKGKKEEKKERYESPLSRNACIFVVR